MTKPEIPGPPHFNSEKEEAEWWDNNEDYIFQEFQRAAAEGRLGHGTVMKRYAERQAEKNKPKSDAETDKP
jgi:hypothetical protein